MEDRQAKVAHATRDRYRVARHAAVWLSLAIVLVALADIAWVAHRRNIPVSVPITNIVAPLSPRGEVDYSAAIAMRFGKKVARTNNAAVALAEALITKAQGLRPPYQFLLLGLHVNTADLSTVGLVHYRDFVKSSAKSAVLLRSLHARDHRHWYNWDYVKPWSARQYPWIDAWISANRLVLDRVARASRRSRFWLSVPARGGDGRDVSVCAVMRDATLLCRPVVRAATELLGRAMLELNRNQIGPCVKDLGSVWRLGALLQQEPFLSDRLCGDILQTDAARGEFSLAASGHLGSADALKLAKPRVQVTWDVSLATCLDTGSRWCILDRLRTMAGDWTNRKAGWLSPIPMRYLFLPPDFAGQMQLANTWTARYLRAMRLPNPVARIAAVMRTSNRRDRAEVAEDALYPWTAVGVCPHVFLPFLDDLQATNYRSLAVITMALTRYRDSHRQFPHSLAELFRGYLSAIPNDAFTGKPFHYRASGQWCLLRGLNSFPRRWMHNLRGLDDRILEVRLGEPPSHEKAAVAEPQPTELRPDESVVSPNDHQPTGF